MANPLACNDNTISSTFPSRRYRFFTITGSNVPSRSRGTVTSTGPTSSDTTVLVRVPLRTLVPSRPG